MKKIIDRKFCIAPMMGYTTPYARNLYRILSKKAFLFSEMIAVWVISFWEKLGSPKQFNLVELGAGNGEMMKVVITTLKNFPEFFHNCVFFIHEKSELLTNQQKQNLQSSK